MEFALHIFLLATINLISFATASSGHGPTVVIDSGVVIGTTTSLRSATASVNKFLSVPFASPPERFSPPQAPIPSYGPIDATSWKSSCIQAFPYPDHDFLVSFLDTPPVPESEDCLYLNVYAPSTPAPASGRAVMFWIYGGSLQFGNAMQPIYDGSAFAAYEDVIVVTANYRTNVFGFPGAPELPKTHQNLGFLDQRAALAWVQRNIRAFGGDPGKVTIFGQSSGGWSIDALLTSYPHGAPFRAAILQSGQFSYKPAPLTGDDSGWNVLAAALNCENATSTLACVRAAPASQIQNLVEQLALFFLPIPDGVTLVESPGEARAKGSFAHVPILCGTNGQEARDYEVTTSNTSEFLQGTFGGFAPEIIPKVRRAYRVGQTGLDSHYDVNAQILTDYEFGCPMSLFANETASQHVPIWRYLFNASFPNTQLENDQRAFHGSELPIVFGTYPGGPVNALTSAPEGIQRTNVPPTPQEIALSKAMQKTWAGFAKCPTCGPGWARLGTANGRYLADFGANGDTGYTLIEPSVIDSRCGLYDPAYEVFNGQLPGI